MNCKQATAEIDEYLDGALPPAVALTIEAHASECVVCGSRLADVRALRQQLKKLGTGTLPAAVLERLLRTAVRSTAEASAGATVGRECCILCVDDEPQVLNGIARQLGRRYRVLTATGGAEALRLLEGDETVAVILSDMRMPRMDGSEFLARARLLAPETARLLLTGYADAEAAARAVNDGGIHRLLMKPCKPDELFAAVDQGVERFRAARLTRTTLMRQLEASLDSQNVRAAPTDATRASEEIHGVLDEARLIAELRDAIDGDTLQLHYQPIVDARLSRLVALEALPVWDHPDLGRISAARTISLAAEGGHVSDLDAWVLRRACREATQLLGLQCGRVAIKISAESLHRHGFGSQLKQALLANGLAPREIELELPDSVFRRGASEVAPLLQDLRARGHRIALDGLGTSCSSLASWQRLPISTLKIAHSRVREDNPRSAGIMTSALAFGQSSGLDVVIDEVGNAAALRGLLDRGASYFQGSAIAMAMSPAAVEAWSRSFNCEARLETASSLARESRQA